MVDSRTREIMLSALERNLGYKEGEKVALIGQSWRPHLPANARPVMDRAIDLWETLAHIYNGAGVNVELFSYIPDEIGSTVEPARNLLTRMEHMAESIGNPDIILAPTAYSLTHTNFMKSWAEKGSRIATMSNSSLAMLSPGGPFDSQEDPAEIIERTEEIADGLRGSEYVRIMGPNSDLVVHIDPNLVHTSTGITAKPGEIGNWLGAEAYAVPVDPRDGGKTYGWFKVPAGWGGRDQLSYDTVFFIDKGRFTDIRCIDESLEAQRWLNENVAPRILPRFGAPEGHDIVAELGFGTNTAINADYLKDNWSIAVAEKMYRSEGGRTVHIAGGNSAGMGGRNNVQYHEDWLVLDVQNIEFNSQWP